MEVELSNGFIMQIDEQDVWVLSLGNWYATRYKDTSYVRVHEPGSGRTGKKLYLHRVLMQAPKELTVDHKNGDGLDNRRENLRLCTSTQNKYNSKMRSHNTSGYKGVCKGYGSKWTASMSCGGRRLYLGTFETGEQAAKAYDAKARELFGEFALLNFPKEAA